tara:strand:+ start:45 stop:521 length:477 start_codon:yes stop_codon:yes gene_type:complete
MKIEIIFLGVIGLVFLIDFIMNSRKKPSIDNVVDQIEGGEPVKKGVTITQFVTAANYILKRKKNFTLFILSVPLTKVFLHYLLYPIMDQAILKRGVKLIRQPHRNAFSKEPDTLGEKYRASVGDHIDAIFTDELLLFIPALILVSLMVWFFNDKIKAR